MINQNTLKEWFSTYSRATNEQINLYSSSFIYHFWQQHMGFTSSKVKLHSRISFMSFNTFLSHSKFLVTNSVSNQQENTFIESPLFILKKNTKHCKSTGEDADLSNLDPNAFDELIASYNHYRRQYDLHQNSPKEPDLTRRLKQYITDEIT